VPIALLSTQIEAHLEAPGLPPPGEEVAQKGDEFLQFHGVNPQVWAQKSVRNGVKLTPKKMGN